jgi:hypothetical protein
MKQNEVDFRVQFGKMPGNAVISRTELAQLLCTTPASISQLVYRGLLPKKAFPNLRRACWFAGDIREWLDREAERLPPTETKGEGAIEATYRRRIGRPRSGEGA